MCNYTATTESKYYYLPQTTRWWLMCDAVCMVKDFLLSLLLLLWIGLKDTVVLPHHSRKYFIRGNACRHASIKPSTPTDSWPSAKSKSSERE